MTRSGRGRSSRERVEAARRQAAIALRRDPDQRDPFVEPPKSSSASPPPTAVRDPNYREWGPKLGDGRRTYPTVRCSNDGRVIVVERHKFPPVPAEVALSGAKSELPTDVKVVYDVTQAQCRNVQFQSQALATEMGADDLEG